MPYTTFDNISRGPYRLQPLATNSMDNRPNLRYAIPFKGNEIWPEKQWQWSKERALSALENNELVITKKDGRWTISYKQYLKDENGRERRSKLYSIIEGIYTQQGTNEIKAIFGDGKTFTFPKPRALIEHLIELSTEKNSLIMDSFAGSGTTGHAVFSINKKDGGKRRFILIEMDTTIARDVTSRRLSLAAGGYQDQRNGKTIEGLGGGYRFCKLGIPLFDEIGNINNEVAFAALATHVFFSETGVPIPKRASGKTPFLGVYENKAVYLMYNGVLRDKRPQSGNVLSAKLLAKLPKHEGPKVIYGEGCRLSSQRLKKEGIDFKQVPYKIKVS